MHNQSLEYGMYLEVIWSVMPFAFDSNGFRYFTFSNSLFHPSCCWVEVIPVFPSLILYISLRLPSWGRHLWVREFKVKRYLLKCLSKISHRLPTKSWYKGQWRLLCRKQEECKVLINKVNYYASVIKPSETKISGIITSIPFQTKHREKSQQCFKDAWG